MNRRMEAALLRLELDKWNAEIEKARWWYKTHPVMSFHGGCALCNRASQRRNKK